MATLTLSDAPQSVPNSNIGVVVGSDGIPFLYGYGVSAPTNGIKFKEDDAVLNYLGEYGLLWVWRGDSSHAKSISYFQSTTPLKVSLTDGLGNPINSLNGALNTHDADIHHSLVNNYFHYHTTTTTFATNAPAGSTQITLTSAVGFAQGDFLHIQDGGYEIVHPRINVLVGNVATLDRPLDNDYVIGDSIQKAILNMAVAGSLAAPISFKLIPNTGEIWHILTITIDMIHGTAGDNGLFGNLNPLTNGVALRFYNGTTGKFTTITNWHTNGGISLDMGGITYVFRSSGGGTYGTNAMGNFKDQMGSIVYINGLAGDYIEFLIQDNLTGLTSFRAKAQGHTEGA